MNKRQERALEVFLYVTFAIALVVGVGHSNGDAGFLSSGFTTSMSDGDALSAYSRAESNQDTVEDIQLQPMISFASNDDKVNAVGRRELLKHAAVLRDNPQLILNIVGHADRRGSELHHQALSMKRARQVYSLLLTYGAAADQLIVDVYSESSPVRDQAAGEDGRSVQLQYFNTLSTDVNR